jgi:GNAT superfamily N-acetyltransferase
LPIGENIELRHIKPGDKLAGLSLGDEAYVPLKTFIKKHAHDYAAAMLAQTYGAFDGEKLAGYVTLVCGEVSAEPAGGPNHGDGVHFNYDHYPAVKIARLAVDTNYRNVGLGRFLVEFSLGVAKDTIATAVGCRFVVLDAKQASVDFYLRVGFRLIDTAENKARAQPVMFLDLKDT